MPKNTFDTTIIKYYQFINTYFKVPVKYKKLLVYHGLGNGACMRYE